MLPTIVKVLLTAVDGEPGVSATVWSVDVPEQFAFVYRWKITLPVGFATEPAVPAAFATYTLSWTTRPAEPVVTTLLFASRMSVVTTSSDQFLLALSLPPEAVFTAVPVVRVIDWLLTEMFDVAETTV